MGLKYFPVGILWVPNLFLWVFRGSKIFCGGYFVGSKFFLEGNYVILREKIYRIKSHETKWHRNISQTLYYIPD